jgi:cellulose synthase/poly-beta-1,6-N-acetylglucosamine synthase-like glycosyltransferase
MAPTIKCMSGSGIDTGFIPFIFLLPYLYYMARIYLGLTRITPTHPRRSSSVIVSVIIPTNKGPEAVCNLPDDLKKQNYSHDAFEVIIADDSNGEWHEDEPVQWAEVPGFRIVANPGHGKKKALDAAIEAARGELIITTDDDCRVGTDWILAIASHYNQYRPGMIICPVELSDDSSFFGQMQQLEFFSLQGVTAGSAKAGDPLMCNGAGLAFRRDLYPGAASLQGSSVSSGDDMFLLHFLKKKGVRIDWLESHSAVVTTEAARGAVRFLRQRSRWASKAMFYTDRSTIFTGIAVMLALLTIGTCLVLSLVDPKWIKTAFILLLVKSVPDYLIIMNRLQFHSRTGIMGYFPIVQLLYPFYAITSLVTGMFRKTKW